MIALTIFVTLSAFFHILFFIFESILWQTPRVRRIFGQSESDAKVTHSLALNQGYYNLFLALAAIAGIVLLHASEFKELGTGLITGSCAVMVGAAIVLLLSAGFKMIRGVLIQGLPPLIALILLWQPVG